MADQADGMIFSENIFSPKFVATEEVELLLRDIKAAQTSCFARTMNIPESFTQVLQRASDALVLLSRVKPAPTKEVEYLIAQLRRFGADNWSDVLQGADCRIPNDSDCDICKQAADVLVSLSREKVVRGSIAGGVLDLTEVSEGILIDIRDRDCEGVNEDIVEEDEVGDYFQAGG